MAILDKLKKGKKEDTAKDAPKAKAKKEAKKVSSKAGTPAASVKRVLIRPIVTEKATVTGTYVFEVAPDANKSEIKKAVQAKYGVTPKNVRVMNVMGKNTRFNYTLGKRKDWKKAIVRLNTGETINAYEGT